MPFERTYVGPDRRYVPDLGVHVLPGDVVKFDVEPPADDPLFVTASKAKKIPEVKQWREDAEAAAQAEVAPDPEPEPDPEPSAPDVPAENEENV